MNWKKFASQTVAVAAMLVASATVSFAQAFDYSTVFAPDPIDVGGPPATFQIDITAGSGAFNLAPTTINLANLKLIDLPPAGPVGVYTFSQNFTIDLTLDPLFPAAGPLTHQVTGNLSGTVEYKLLGPFPVTSTFSNVVFTLPTITPYNPLVYDFGSAGKYIVDTPDYTAFGPSGASTEGAITVLVSYVPAVPEPGEYAVMGMAGLTVCGLMVRARRRRSTKGMAS